MTKNNLLSSLSTKKHKSSPTDDFQSGDFPYYRGNHPMGIINSNYIYHYFKDSEQQYEVQKVEINNEETRISQHLFISISQLISTPDLFDLANKTTAISITICFDNEENIKEQLEVCYQLLQAISNKIETIFIEFSPKITLKEFLIIQKTLKLLWGTVIGNQESKKPLYFVQEISKNMDTSEVIFQLLKAEWGENNHIRIPTKKAQKEIQKIEKLRAFLIGECCVHPVIDPLGGSFIIDEQAVKWYSELK